jgi:hypothetical protein
MKKIVRIGLIKNWSGKKNISVYCSVAFENRYT